MNDEEFKEELKALDEFFIRLGLEPNDVEATTFAGFPHHWDQTLPHCWGEEELWEFDPFIGEEWMRYDPREGF